MRVRSGETEWLDTEAFSPEEVAACLHDLAAVNTATLARAPTLAFMRRLVRRHPGRALRVLDVGCGEGDMLRRLHRWAARAGVAVELTGLDLSSDGNRAARAATPAGVPIDYITADIFGGGLDTYDVILSSLFTHHLSDEQVVAFVRVMERHAGLGWFVNDLHRHLMAYYGFQALGALAGWHPIVRHDGAISVARSFVRADWSRLLAAAGVEAEIAWHVPFRYGVSRFK